MAWTAARTWVTAEVVTAALMNTHWRDNLAYLKGQAGAVTVEDQLNFHNDAAFYTAIVSGSPVLAFDANDYIQYNRSTNVLSMLIGGSSQLEIGADTVDAKTNRLINANLDMESNIVNDTTQRTGTGDGNWNDLTGLSVSVTLAVAGTVLAAVSFKKTKTGGDGPGTTRIEIDGTAGQEDAAADSGHVGLVGRKASCTAGARTVKLQHYGANGNHASTYDNTTIRVYAIPDTALA